MPVPELRDPPRRGAGLAGPDDRHVDRDALRRHPGDLAGQRSVQQRAPVRTGRLDPSRRPRRLTAARARGLEGEAAERAVRGAGHREGAEPVAARRSRPHGASPPLRLRVPPGRDPWPRRAGGGDRVPAHRRRPRRRRMRLGRNVRRAPPAVRDRPPDGNRRRGASADQVLHRCVDQAHGADAGRGRHAQVGADRGRDPRVLPGALRPPAARTGRHASQCPRQPRDPGVGSSPDGQRAAHRGDVGPLRRRVGDDDERSLRPASCC